MKRFWLCALLSLLEFSWGCNALGPSLPSFLVAERAFFGRLRNWLGKNAEQKPEVPVAPVADEDAGSEEESSSHYGVKTLTKSTTTTTTTTTVTSTKPEGVWEEEYDSMEVPYTPLPPLRGIGMLGGAIFISLAFNWGRLPLLLGGIGVVQYIDSVVQRMHARRAADAALKRFEDRRELVRARRRRRWIQTFYSHNALQQDRATRKGETQNEESNATLANSSTGKGDGGTAGSEAPPRGIHPDAASERTRNTGGKKGSLHDSGLHAEGSDKRTNPSETRGVPKTRLRKPTGRNTKAQVKEKTPRENLPEFDRN
ncbi:hypothetical protein TGDOM2_290700 [Toxoplasma gondii GAB2-2007-GAL-DOM2]|uniref:Transmembrane protein n=5 Tax=Toxoplasma gondii TaxID=5811 RepID=S7W4F0_TOXGG|nr:hypothetical protein TGGT1_290700 [Toxoplasma gondii GT1]KAF4644521.1 hypothetical protein TGRH88_015150 [Toxoplasma gondii]KFG42339.1 hypothetical protein TGDOM2_290700 [Toxoplasma gondii GAB2-2007-GAL-DOM2]KFG53422.1 hypothetical protein TGFOU_290700 [Toxoplasma gondii FOU]RQX73660.1 hypothetical protein TGCAST_290700 [Toxoplasma gondii CAST]